MNSKKFAFSTTEGFFSPQNDIKKLIDECASGADLEKLVESTISKSILIQNKTLALPSLKQSLFSFAIETEERLALVHAQIELKAFNGLLRQIKVLQDKDRTAIASLSKLSTENVAVDNSQDAVDGGLSNKINEIDAFIKKMEKNATATLNDVEKNFNTETKSIREMIDFRLKDVYKRLDERVIKTVEKEAVSTETTTAAAKANEEAAAKAKKKSK